MVKRAARRSQRAVGRSRCRTPRLAPRPRSRHAVRRLQPAQRLLVRLKDGATPDWPSFCGGCGSASASSLAVERQIGNVWVLNLTLPQPSAHAGRVGAQTLQGDADVQYADPVRRAFRVRGAERPVLFAASGRSTAAPRASTLETAWTLQPSAQRRDRRGHRHRHPAASRPRGPRAAGLRLHLRSGARARRQRARPRSARRRRLERRRLRSAPTPSFFHGLFVAGLIARQHQQRRRHRRPRQRRKHPAGARARQVRRHVRGRAGGHAVGVGRARSPACHRIPIPPRSST